MEANPTRASESVWDYPRPPRVDDDNRLVVVKHGSVVIAETRSARRVLETSHPPVFYISPADVNMALLRPNSKRTFCEFKGYAGYWDIVAEPKLTAVAWSYPDPTSGYESLTDWLAFYPSKLDCFVDGERVKAQDGAFYGGWITEDIEGPFKGGPGTSGW